MILIEAIFVSVVSGLIVAFVMMTYQSFQKTREKIARAGQEQPRKEKVVFDVRDEKERSKRP